MANKRNLITLFIFTIFVIPIFWEIFSPKALIRFQGTSTFKPEAHLEMFADEVKLRNEAINKHDSIGILFYNRRLFPIKVFLQGYISHFNPQWLFTNSSNEPFKIPNMGLLYLWEAPFVVIGFPSFLFSQLLDGKTKKLVFLWFFLGPLPGAIATQAPHAMRAYNILPTWQIFTAFGLIYFFYKLKRFKIFITLAFSLCILLSLQTLYKNYFIVFPKEQSGSFQYAISKTVSYALSQENKYRKIVFSNSDNLYQSYMFFLYYSHYDPLYYQELGGTKSGGFAETHRFDKYEFRPIVWNKDSLASNTLFVGNLTDFPKNLNAKLFSNLDGKYVVEVVR